MTPRQRYETVGYLGWTGYGNMGDEAIHQALVHSLPGLDLVPVPLGPRAAVRAGRRLRVLRHSPLLLGGGTVLGRRIWRLHLRQALALSARVPALMLGAGVEDPTFARIGHLSERHELPRWRSLLGRFEEVTVRGPRSAELLHDVGIPARVVGDPALLLNPDEGEHRQLAEIHQAPLLDDAPLLGVNLGVSDDLWGHDQARVVTEVAEVVRRMAPAGWRFRALVVNPADRDDAVRCGQQAGLSEERWEIVEASDPWTYLAAVQPCRLVIAERLHAGVLAARAGVAPITLEYQPKCRDFLRSVGLEHLAVRTDQVAAGALFDLVEATDADLPTVTANLRHHVATLRSALGDEVSRIATRLAGVEQGAR
jgi:polysaccharide pyruvyl transferase WcaK-like protein